MMPELIDLDIECDDSVQISLNEVRDLLRKRSYLYESPHDFRAGVEAALSAILREASRTAAPI